MPGKIIQKLSKIKVSNPVILLDEIDKMASDFRGDPSAALLEVLDPEQNKNFNDHYLDVDYDLSDVMFIATANSMNIPAPLLDRMEVIRLSGYTEDEKLNIAENHLLPKQMKLTGLKKNELIIDPIAITSIIRHYTLEAGVRNLERELAKICRKVVKKHLEEDQKNSKTSISRENLEDYLGVVKYCYYHPENEDKIGLVNGLAWTEVGGEMLTVESVFLKGKGKVTLTGKLGEVMQESIQAALTVVRSRCDALNIAPNFFEEHDIHIHVPEGATPKDGPSAGITVCTALLSSATSSQRNPLEMPSDQNFRPPSFVFGYNNYLQQNRPPPLPAHYYTFDHNVFQNDTAQYQPASPPPTPPLPNPAPPVAALPQSPPPTPPLPTPASSPETNNVTIGGKYKSKKHHRYTKRRRHRTVSTRALRTKSRRIRRR